MSHQSYDSVVVGSGWAGAVVAERLASAGKKVLVLEKRNHIGGNCWEEHDLETGVLYHLYGPHIFHTDNEDVFRYLSRFTNWRIYQHRVVADIDGVQVPIPFNFNTLHLLFPPSKAGSIEKKLLASYPLESRIPILELRQHSDPEVQELADFVYRKVFLNYSAKQWGKRPEEISHAVTGRVPIVLSRDNRYFPDRWQLMPQHGFNPVFKQLLFRPGVHVMLNTRWQDLLTLDESRGFRLNGQPFSGQVVYTAPIDELFAYDLGELPYRSLRFEYERHPVPQVQPVAVVNYPNLGDFTRVTEYKHLSGQTNLSATLLMREYPQDYVRTDAQKDIPYYPVFQSEAQATYAKYASRAQSIPNLTLLGRLAEYRYYDQDDVIAAALGVKL
jgi:UDP-galactopyranose mutase